MESIRNEIETLTDEMGALAVTQDSGVLIFGMMNVGRSTFSNTLLGRQQFVQAESTIQVASVNKPGGGKLNVF